MILGIDVTMVMTDYSSSIPYYFENPKDFTELLLRSLFPHSLFFAFACAFVFEFSGIGRSYD